MFDSKIKIRKDLLEKLKVAAIDNGVPTVEEFVENALEKELERIERGRKEEVEAQRRQKEADSITEKLKGLGYID